MPRRLPGADIFGGSLSLSSSSSNDEDVVVMDNGNQNEQIGPFAVTLEGTDNDIDQFDELTPTPIECVKQTDFDLLALGSNRLNSSPPPLSTAKPVDSILTNLSAEERLLLQKIQERKKKLAQQKKQVTRVASPKKKSKKKKKEQEPPPPPRPSEESNKFQHLHSRTGNKDTTMAKTRNDNKQKAGNNKRPAAKPAPPPQQEDQKLKKMLFLLTSMGTKLTQPTFHMLIG